MAEEKTQRYFLEVKNGDARGLIYYIGEEPILIGSGSNATLKIDAPQVKAEHVMVNLVQGRVWIENLSSSGTRLGGRLINKRTLIAVGESFSIGTHTEITLGIVGRQKKSSPANIIFPVILGMIIIAGIIVNVSLLRKKSIAERPVTQANWNEAYSRISDHLKIWQSKSLIPADFVDQFSQAWFRERSGDQKGALAQWRIVYNAMTGLSIDGVTPKGRTIASSVRNEPGVLHVFMGREWARDPDIERLWKNLDDSYMNALWWFVSLRIENLKKSIKNN